MPDRWSTDQIEALAPDASSQKAARKLASTAPWSQTGAAGGDEPALWGLCKGSGAKPYQACVDLTGPAYKCSCPSRKFPCKHTLALLLLWSAGQVSEAGVPDWVQEWRAGRKARAVNRERPAEPADPKAAQRRAQQRADRVAAGLVDLDRWLHDQVRNGLASAEQASYQHWESPAARLVDAQAPTVAGTVRRLGDLPGSGADWPGRLLDELGMLRLLTSAYQRIDTLPAEMAATVRTRVGLAVPQQEVLATPAVRDRWLVLGHRDVFEDKLTVRRCWLRGASTGRSALVLAFAAPGQALPADLVAGTLVDADLHFYPGSLPLRAVVGTRHTAAVTAPVPLPFPADDIPTSLDSYAAALAAEPWLEQWPMLLAAVVPVHDGGRWQLVTPDGTGLPLDPSFGDPWPAVAVGGGRPLTVAAEWCPRGLWPLTWLTAEGISQ